MEQAQVAKENEATRADRTSAGAENNAESVDDASATAANAEANMPTAVTEQAGAAHLRVSQPNQAVTLDYNPQRLNIVIDEDDIIIRLSCG